MGLYREHVLPRLVDWACSTPDMRRWRSDVTMGLSGRVLEIGFGSGLNLEHYPDQVDVVLAVEPASIAKRLAERRIAARDIPVEHVGLDGQHVPLPDASCDSALSTFTLCTIADPEAALAEIRRVLRPGQAFHFLEHGLSPDPRIASWQRRFDPLQQRMAGGCHLTRNVPELVRQAGFRLERCTQAYAKGPKPWTWFTLGMAVNSPQA